MKLKEYCIKHYVDSNSKIVDIMDSIMYGVCEFSNVDMKMIECSKKSRSKYGEMSFKYNDNKLLKFIVSKDNVVVLDENMRVLKFISLSCVFCKSIVEFVVKDVK